METCPPSEQLRLLESGKLPGDQARRLEAHIEKCPGCQHRLRQLLSDPISPPSSGPRRRVAEPLPPLPGYEVLRELGRGGTGVVYRAWQKGLDRPVALKTILSGSFADPRERERFRRETQAVALLQHPNIIQIHEVGEVDGRPFFAMEFAAGGSLTQRLNGIPLPPRQAASLTAALAQAVHHAHERKIVHRDLKPSNILLLGSPEAPLEECVLKVSDFGLAKRLDECGHTQSGAVLGTPSYMAPEQACGNSRAIGPATDVYGLGAVLYELLTGRPPFHAATRLETLKQVCECEPVPPRRLQPSVPRDLETICLKCLEKEPSNRYSTANAMAADLRLFLDGRPIRARPVGLGERTGRWCRRNPGIASLTAALAFVTVAGFVAILHFWHQAADGQRQTLTLLGKEQDARREAEEDRRRTRQILTDFVRFGRLPPQETPYAQRGLSIDQLLRAAAHYQNLLGKQPADVELQAALADVNTGLSRLHYNRGQFPEALNFAEKARVLWRQVVRERLRDRDYRAALAANDVLLGLIYKQQDEPALALQAYQRSYALEQELVAEKPTPASQFQLAVIGRFLCESLIANGRPAEGLRVLEASEAIVRKLFAKNPDKRGYRKYLAETCTCRGDFHQQKGEHAEALRCWQEAYDLWKKPAEQRPDDREARRALAFPAKRLIRPGAAEPYYTEALGGYEEACEEGIRRVEPTPTNAVLRSQLLSCYRDLAQCHAKAGQTAREVQVYEQLAATLETLARPHPADRGLCFDRVGAWIQVGDAHRLAGSPLKAAQAYRRGVQALEGLAERSPADFALTRDVLACFWRLAGTYRDDLKQPPAALDTARQAAALLGRYSPDSAAADEGSSFTLAENTSSVAFLLSLFGSPAQGLPLAERSRRMFETLVRKAPEQLRYQLGLVDAWNQIAKAHFKLDQFDRAVQAWSRSVDVQRTVVALAHEETAYRQKLGDRYLRLGRDLRERGRLAEAEAWFLEQEKLWRKDRERLMEVSRELDQLAAAVGGGRKELSFAERAQRQRYLEQSHGVARKAATLPR